MKYIVDEVIDNTVKCEVYGTTDIVYLSLNDFSFSVSDGDIILCNEDGYQLLLNEKEKRLTDIKRKFDKLKNIK